MKYRNIGQGVLNKYVRLPTIQYALRNGSYRVDIKTI